MGARTAFRSVLPAIVLAFVSSSLVRAQLPPSLERCLPFPPPGDELGETKAESPERKIAFDAIRFENNSEVPNHVQRLLVRAVRSQSLEEYPGWTDELSEVPLRGALQQDGYFRAEVSAKARILHQDAEYEHVSLTIRVDPGAQYSLGSVRFRSIDPGAPLAFPVQQLRKLIPMRDREIFDVSKLREGFDALKTLYASSGWIDFTPSPGFDIDDAAKRINLTLEMDQEIQYRVGKIEILGDNRVVEKVLMSTFKAGEPFNANLLKQFYAENESILPGASAQYNASLEKDAKNGVVNLRFDFRTCPAIWE